MCCVHLTGSESGCLSSHKAQPEPRISQKDIPIARHVHIFSISGTRRSHVTQNRLLCGDSPEVFPLLDETGMRLERLSGQNEPCRALWAYDRRMGTQVEFVQALGQSPRKTLSVLADAPMVYLIV